MARKGTTDEAFLMVLFRPQITCQVPDRPTGLHIIPYYKKKFKEKLNIAGNGLLELKNDIMKSLKPQHALIKVTTGRCQYVSLTATQEVLIGRFLETWNLAHGFLMVQGRTLWILR
ncbi:hypothetical protein J6590_003849 [Homalodisca vitripennis]|nr:hypothetical protein J6590_003849 [Homalodisca vitripennis]